QAWQSQHQSEGRRTNAEPGTSGSETRTVTTASWWTQSLPSCPKRVMARLQGQYRVRSVHDLPFPAREDVRNGVEGVDTHRRILAAPLQLARTLRSDVHRIRIQQVPHAFGKQTSDMAWWTVAWLSPGGRRAFRSGNAVFEE